MFQHFWAAQKGNPYSKGGCDNSQQLTAETKTIFFATTRRASLIQKGAIAKED
jgi:hypothetical protein